MKITTGSVVALVVSLGAALPAQAQSRPSIGVELASDESRRGLSWSENRLTGSADIAASLSVIDASARVAMTRGSARHGGADAVADLEVGTGWSLGAVRLRGHATGHLFAGARANLDYLELGGSASFTYGPLQLRGGAVYAPDQSAIGGDNLYLYGGASAGIPTTPLTLSAGIGRSSGSTDDPIRAARLRPGGTYTDWRIGIEHVQAPLTLGVDYVGTNIARRDFIDSPYADARHSGDRVLARARLSF